MDEVFTLTYPEFFIANFLGKILHKKKGYSVHIPLNRQQRGHDLLLFYSNSMASARIQIKSSRSYQQKPPKILTGNQRFQYGLWFMNFKYRKNDADFYFLFAHYPRMNVRLNNARLPEKWWDYRLLIFRDKEMGRFLSRLKTRSGKRKHSFILGFDEDDDETFLLVRSGKHESLRMYNSDEVIKKKSLQNFLHGRH
jgi:hypothetical protein